ncbi:MAG: hypothetical protein ACK4SY_07055 [Pyrobaculum sp.]
MYIKVGRLYVRQDMWESATVEVAYMLIALANDFYSRNASIKPAKMLEKICGRRVGGSKNMLFIELLKYAMEKFGIEYEVLRKSDRVDKIVYRAPVVVVQQTNIKNLRTLLCKKKV